MKSVLLSLWLSSACVVRQYGAGPTTSAASVDAVAPVDFSDVQARLERMIVAETENVDRRDRLEAAWELGHKMKTERASAQHLTLRFLMRFVEVEKRNQDADTDAVADPNQQDFVPISSIAAQRIGTSVEAAPAVHQVKKRVAIVPPDAGATAVMDSARERMGAGDLEGARRQLAVCEGQPCGAATVTLYREVIDRLVYQRREAAGVAFLAARELGDKGNRMAEFRKVALDLRGLARDYPDSRYAVGVAESLATVDAALTNPDQ
jgi:hypothetical protein